MFSQAFLNYPMQCEGDVKTPNSEKIQFKFRSLIWEICAVRKLSSVRTAMWNAIIRVPLDAKTAVLGSGLCLFIVYCFSRMWWCLRAVKSSAVTQNKVWLGTCAENVHSGDGCYSPSGVDVGFNFPHVEFQSHNHKFISLFLIHPLKAP